MFFYRSHDTARIPKRSTVSAAGFDLSSAFKYNIKPNTLAEVDTGIKVIFPSGYYGRIAGRSGLALKYKLFVAGGKFSLVFLETFVTIHQFVML